MDGDSTLGVASVVLRCLEGTRGAIGSPHQVTINAREITSVRALVPSPEEERKQSSVASPHITLSHRLALNLIQE